MKFRFDGVGLLVVVAFLLLVAAFGSLWWTGQGRSYRQTIRNYFEIPDYYANMKKHTRDQAKLKTALKQKCREVFTGALLQHNIHEIERRSLSGSMVDEIFPGLNKAVIGEQRTSRNGRYRMTDTVLLKTRSSLREKRIFHLVFKGKRWFIENIVIPAPKTKSPGEVAGGTDKDLAARLNNPLWLDLNRQLADFYQQKQFLGAIKTAKEALQTAEKIFGTEDPGTAIATSNLALVYLRQDRFDESSWLFKKARSIVINFTGGGSYRNLNLKSLGLLNQSSEYKMWAWPMADFKVAGIEPGMGEAEVRKILGEPSPVKETLVSGQPKKSDDGKELIYPQFTLCFSGTGTEFRLRQIRITGGDSATLRGIQVGDSKLAVLWVYGPPVKEEAGLMEYRGPEGKADEPMERYIQFKINSLEAVQEIEIGIR